MTPRSKNLGLPLLLSGLPILAVFLLLLSNDLIWDDHFFITINPELGQPAFIQKALTSPFWEGSAYSAGQMPDLYRPLTSLLLWSAAMLSDRSPAGMHLLSILCALAAAIAFGRLCYQIIQTPERRAIAVTMTLAVLAHPLTTEVSAMVVNISDLLVALCLCAVLTTQIHAFQRNRLSPGTLITTALWGFLAACAKETGVLFLCLPLFSFSLARPIQTDTPSASTLLLRRPAIWIATIAPVLLYLILRHFVFQASIQTTDLVDADTGVGPVAIFLGFGQAVFTAILPIPGGAHRYLDPMSSLPWILSLSIIVIVILSRWRNRPDSRWPTRFETGLCLAILLIAPATAAVPELNGTFRFAQRYFYVPMFGVLLALLPVICDRWNNAVRLAPFFVGLLALLSLIRVAEWRTMLDFTEAEAAYHPNSAFEQLAAASVRIRAGRFDDAEPFLQQARTARFIDVPAHRSSLYAAGARISAFRDGDFEQATLLARAAVEIDGANLEHLTDLADYRFMAQKPTEAIAILEEALLRPWFTPFQKTEIQKRIQYYREPTP